MDLWPPLLDTVRMKLVILQVRCVCENALLLCFRGKGGEGNVKFKLSRTVQSKYQFIKCYSCDRTYVVMNTSFVQSYLITYSLKAASASYTVCNNWRKEGIHCFLFSLYSEELTKVEKPLNNHFRNLSDTFPQGFFGTIN